MTTLEHSSHAIRRKGYAPHYTPTNVAKFQPEMREIAFELVNVKGICFFITVFANMMTNFRLLRMCVESLPWSAWLYSDTSWLMWWLPLPTVIASER